MIKPKILVIVGPTASGKTSLSIQLAKKYEGEIVSTDSRQLYRGLDIGTGKVTQKEMMDIPHHLLDVADPKDIYTVADYVRDGRIAIHDILARNHTPILAGGTFLYIDALLGKISTPEVSPDTELRTHLETLDTDTLFEMLQKKDPARAETIDKANKRRLIRAIEIVSTLGAVPETHSVELYNTLTIGIHIEKEELIKNIHTRLIERIKTGMIDEVATLHKNGLSYERLSELGIEYQYISQYLQNIISEAEMCAFIETKSWQYAKRQMTWLKRNPNIVWVEKDDIAKIENIVRDFLK